MLEYVDFCVWSAQAVDYPDGPPRGDWAEAGRGEGAMLARQRQTLIVDRVREDGAVRVADLVRELGVSDMTVRRDLELLHDRGLLEKVHGGATAVVGTALFEPGFALKVSLQQGEKDAIAHVAG